MTMALCVCVGRMKASMLLLLRRQGEVGVVLGGGDVALGSPLLFHLGLNINVTMKEKVVYYTRRHDRLTASVDAMIFFFSLEGHFSKIPRNSLVRLSSRPLVA